MSLKIYGSLSLLALLFSFAAAKVPSYIEVCGRRNPELDKCIIESGNKLLPLLQKGIPELDIPPMEPLYVDEIALANIDTFKAIATNVKLYGLSDYDVKHFHMDFKNKSFYMESIFPKIYMEADYDVKARILVPINEKGPIKTITKNVLIQAILKFELIDRRNKTLMYFSSMTANVDVKDYEAVFRPDNNTSPLTQAINTVLESSQQEIIESMKPNLEAAISKKVLELANKIVKHFTFDELFPDRP